MKVKGVINGQMGENIQVIGSRIKSMEEEHFSSKTVTVTMVIGSTACLREKVE